MVASFVKYADAMKITPPQDYSVEEIRKWAETYKIEKQEGMQPQNVIMVMNESLADMSL